MKQQRRNFVLATLAAMMISAPAVGQDAFPDRPVRLIVPYGAGTTTDTVSRMLAQRLSEKWGQAVVVENLTGAAGVIGTRALISSAADGYTLAMIASNYAMNPAIFEDLPYDSLRDISPIVHVTSNDFVFAVHPSLGVNSIGQLIEKAKASPNSIFYGSSGNGGSPHLAVAKFTHMAQVEMNHVPYKAMGAAVTDLLAGRVAVVATSLTTLLPHINSGSLIGLATTGLTRNPSLPDMPTVHETLSGYEVKNWNGIVAPVGLSDSLKQKIFRDVSTVFKEPEFEKQLSQQSAQVDLLGPADFMRRIENEVATWKQVVRESKAGIS